MVQKLNILVIDPDPHVGSVASAALLMGNAPIWPTYHRFISPDVAASDLKTGRYNAAIVRGDPQMVSRLTYIAERAGVPHMRIVDYGNGNVATPCPILEKRASSTTQYQVGDLNSRNTWRSISDELLRYASPEVIAQYPAPQPQGDLKLDDVVERLPQIAQRKDEIRKQFNSADGLQRQQFTDEYRTLCRQQRCAAEVIESSRFRALNKEKYEKYLH